MRAAWYERNGEARDVLTVGELPDPQPAAGEVRVRVHASGVNPSDVKSRRGRPLDWPRIIPHSDGAGVIDAVGSGVPASRIGQRVWLWNSQWDRPDGTAAQWLCLPAQQAVQLPDETSFDIGACIGIPVLTALRAIRLAGDLDGRTVLVTGAGSVVGNYVTQLAVQRGATVIGTAGSPARVAIAREAGAAHIIDYRSEPVAERVRELTDGHGAEVAIDMDFQSSSRWIGQGLMRTHGRFVCYGSNDTGEIPVPVRSLLWGSLNLSFFLVYVLQDAERASLNHEIDALLRSQALKHRFADDYALDDIVQAHEAVEAGRRVGVVLVRP